MAEISSSTSRFDFRGTDASLESAELWYLECAYMGIRRL